MIAYTNTQHHTFSGSVELHGLGALDPVSEYCIGSQLLHVITVPDLLPRELLVNARVFDVGCNEGWVSCKIGFPQLWDARRVVGVDIDDTLVSMAWRRRRTLRSHQAPLSEISLFPSTCASRRKRKCGASYPIPTPPSEMAAYFPASCQHLFGPLSDAFCG
ncbi:hypothetical protein F5888DRAFT_1617167 [Russula emetica]|nr:hypothetical protein F5888DRAFT_1617167 [Russula emetica]